MIFGYARVSVISQDDIFLFRMKNPLQAHSANIKYDTNLNPLLRKELAKIKLRIIKKVTKAHLQLEIQKLQMCLPSNQTVPAYYKTQSPNI